MLKSIRKNNTIRKNNSTKKQIFRYKMCFLVELFFLIVLFFLIDFYMKLHEFEIDLSTLTRGLNAHKYGNHYCCTFKKVIVTSPQIGGVHKL